MMKVLYLLLSFSLNAIVLNAQCTCTGCPYFVDENNPATDQITVSGLTNPTLGVGGQDVCEIRVHVNSEGIGELRIIVTSPSGSQVELMTNTSNFTGTNFTFDISFLRCSDSPIPDAGFPAMFDAGAGWVSNTTYTGSYYPESGDCLEDFTGSANGVWTIDFTDNIFFDDHNILGWEIIFCDGSGTSCGPPNPPCDANAGDNHPQSPISACVGDPSLDLNLTVDYQGTTPSDPSLYAYEWIISDLNTLGIVDAIVTTPDLTTYPVGTYAVCGFSYLIADQALIPSPNGILTIDDIQDDIVAGLYCADIVTSCAQVDILNNIADPMLDWSPPIDLCQGQPYTFNVTNFDPSLNYLTAINSGSFSQFSFNNGVLVIAGIAGPINICVSIQEDCDAGQTCQTFNVVNATPLDLSTQADVCIGDDFTISVLPPNNTSTYTWTINGPGVLVQDNNDNIIVQATGVGTIDVCAEDLNTSCGPPTPICTPINVINVPPPSIFADPFYCLPGDFLVGNANGSATSTVYTQVSGPGTITFFNPNVVATSFTVDLPGIYTIQLTKTFNGCTVSTTATFEVLPELQIASSAVCNNGSFVITITFLNGQALYSVFGVPIVGNTYTSPAYPTGSAVLTLYEDANGCEGQVFYQEFCTCTTDAGTMDQTPIEFCDLTGVANAIHNNNAVLDSDDIGIYILHTSSTDILGTVLDQNSTGIFTFSNPPLTSGVTYYISYVVGTNVGGNIDLSDPCLDVSIGTPVQWLDPIIASISIQSDVDVCDLFLSLIANSNAPIGSSVSHQWSVFSAPAGGSVIFSNPTGMITDLTFSDPGIYEIRYQGDLDGCLFEDIFLINAEEAFVISPPLLNCTSDGSTYTVNFTISGGTSPVLIDGILYNGISFESAPIINGMPYNFVVSDASNCPPQNVSGTNLCPCSSDAGSMSNNSIIFCDPSSIAISTFNNDDILDANDVAFFVLHDGASNILGNIYDFNTTGNFSLLTGMSTGVTYYISHVVGNPDGSFVELSDPCLSISFGQAVIWNNPPEIVLPNDFQTCDLSVNVQSTIQSGVNVEWFIVNAPFGSNPIIFNPTSTQADIDFDLEGVYILELVATEGSCQASETIEITILPQIDITNLRETCEGGSYRVSFDIIGGEEDFDINGIIINGSSYTSNLIASGDAYNFTITDFNNCQYQGIQGVKNCDCESDAGTMSNAMIEICGSGLAVADSNQNSILDPDDIGLYYLHTGDGASLGTILSINNTGIFAKGPNMDYNTTYYISYVVGNPLSPNEIDLTDPCLDIASGQAVIWLPLPTSTLLDSLIFCNDSLELRVTEEALQFLNLAANTINLSYVQIDSSIFIQLEQIVDTNIVFEYIQNNCSIMDSVHLINRGPIQVNGSIICSLNGQLFNYEAIISGGTPPYVVNGDTLASNLFVLENIPVVDTIAFQVNDREGCNSEVNSIYAICDCYTPSHQMSPIALMTCDSETCFTVVFEIQDILGANDKGTYVLHDRSDNILGTMISINSEGIFKFTSNMNLDQTYFVSYISGDSLLDGSIDFEDPCLSVSPGQALTFQSSPNLPGFTTDTICENSLTLDRFFNSDEIIFRPIGINAVDLTLNIEQNFVTLSASSFGTYEVERSITSICTLVDTVSFHLLEPLRFEFYEETCSDDNNSYTISFQIFGGEAPYSVNGAEISGNSFISSSIDNTSEYDFIISANGVCEELILSGNVDCSCPSIPSDLEDLSYTSCAGEDILVALSNPGNVSSGFAETFVLHDGSSQVLGNIIASYQDNTIAYQSNIPLDVVLTASPIVGPLSNGEIDLTDPCTLLGNSASVIWRSPSLITIEAPEIICLEDGFVDLLIDVSAPEFPISLSLEYGGQSQTIELGSTGITPITLVDISEQTTINFTAIGAVCWDESSLPPIEIDVEQCECDENLFNFNPILCADISIDLNSWVSEGPSGNWDIVSSTDNSKVQLASSLLSFDPAYSGELVLSYQPSGSLSCDTIYTIQVDIEESIDLNLTTATEIICQDEANAMDLNSLLIGQGINRGQWKALQSMDSNSFSESTINTAFLDAGTYLFEFQIENLEACSYSPLLYTLIIPDRPDYIITSNNPACFGENGSISITLNDPNGIEAILINGQDISDIDIDALSPGTYDIQLSDTDLCQYLEQILIEEAVSLSLDLNGDVIINEGQQAVLTSVVDGGTEPYTYQWSVNGEIIDGVDEGSLSLNISEDIEVLLTVFDANGCSLEDLIILRIQEEKTPVVLANIISPSNISNSVFTIPKNPSIEKVNQFSIYDRWGSLIFSVKDVDLNLSSIEWDGRKNGQFVSPGVYVYMLSYESTSGQNLVKHGDITVIF